MGKIRGQRCNLAAVRQQNQLSVLALAGKERPKGFLRIHGLYVCDDYIGFGSKFFLRAVAFHECMCEMVKRGRLFYDVKKAVL